VTATLPQKIFGRFNALVLPSALDMIDLRITHYDRSVDPARPEYNEHVVFSFWHEYISVVLPRWGHTPLTILCSKHRDGEWVNQTGLALGLRVVRGSTGSSLSGVLIGSADRSGRHRHRQSLADEHLGQICDSPTDVPSTSYLWP